MEKIIQKDPLRNWILWGIPVISILASPMHFVYDWTGKIAIVGAFAPTNESIFEHLKLAFWPMLIWWVLGYYIYRKSEQVFAGRWFSAATAAMIICPLIIMTFYYTYTGALGIHFLVLDISSLFIGVILAHLSALHIYRYQKTGPGTVYLAVIILILLCILFLYLSFAPPHLPLFMDSLTGQYGM